MPNHCNNILVVSGPQPDLTKFQEAARSEDNPLDINQLLPMPTAIRNTTNPNQDPISRYALFTTYGAYDWYDWALKNWGTKWGAYLVEAKPIKTDDQNSSDNTNYPFIKYSYQTAWAPFSDDALIKISKQFPNLTFKMQYEEIGMHFSGYTIAVAGEMIEQQYANDLKFGLSDEYDDEADVDINESNTDTVVNHQRLAVDQDFLNALESTSDRSQ